ncbi:MAG: collagen type alpha, partial [Pseudonocardiales bacterium]|nr:collagen type alpha [Pseudonocardiales bacterium]
MRVPAVTASGAGLLASAVALRWSRPDLTAALAEHVGEVRAGDDRTWVAAAGWLVHGRAAIGDGRQCASDALAEIARRGQGLLDDPAADRLRIEIATLAAGQCEPAVARSLVAPVLAADRSADVRADAYGVLARCVMEERPATIGEATKRAEVAWGEMGGADADIASAALALISAAALRRSGHPESAVDHAAEGLARLDEIRAAQEGAPSRHLAAALAAEWITALVEAGRTDDAREACAPMAQQLRKTSRPTRQIALLRLAVARAVADSAPAAAVEALEQAAQDAAACDTPDLEGLCLSTLGALREQAGRLDAALESMRRGVAAQRRDRARSEQFREALRSMSVAAPAVRTEAVVAPLDRIERAMSKPARAHAPSAAVAAAVHPLADACAADPWSSGSWVDRSAGAAATTRNGRRRRPSRATGSSLGLADVDVPLVTATGDNAARLGFDSGAGTRPGAGVVRGASSADEAGADGVASGSSPDVSAGGTDVAATSGRHAGGAGRDTASPIADSDASGPAVTQVNASESAGQAIDTAP